MAIIRSFQGVIYATSAVETFYGVGLSDTVSYANAPSSGTVGQYDYGVTINLPDPYLSTGLAWGDRFSGVETIAGSQYTDFMYGDSQANRFDGGGSPDFLYGRGGNDTLRGSGGFDFLYGEGGNDVLYGQWHTDTLNGGDGDDKIWGGSNYVNHYYPGTNYADVLYGDAGNDQLHGDVPRAALTVKTEYNKDYDFMPGADEIHGGVGNDLLNGDGGNDKLWGDGGADTFQVDAPYTVTDAAGRAMRITSGDDLILNFNPAEGDRLKLGGQAYIYASTASGIVITLGDPAAPAGHVTLWQVSGFDKAWVI